ncbi:unnamed protein product, partial [Rotaria sp. Silwood1]
MTEPLLSTPQNILDLQGADLFAYVRRYCSEDIVKYFELLGIRSIDSLLGINDIFLRLKEDYLELTDIKKKLTFNRPDGTCIIKLGIQYDINKLFESLQNTLVNDEQVTTAATVKEDLVLSSEVIEKYPFLQRLVHFFIKLSQNVNPTDEPFLHHFLENLLSNLSLAKSRYRYSGFTIDFALCLSILAGRNAYEFIRLNIPGALPNLTIIQTKIAKEGFHTVEGEFRYDDMKKYLTTIDSTFVYCAEDCTSAVRKIVYDVQSNSFVGFTPPLDAHGMPRIQHFQTNSFEDLKAWPTIGHSSLFKVAIPVSWSWFYLSGEQLFLCMQDAMHICTKLRNRLLSSSSYMLMGNNTVSIDYLLHLIESKSKFEHNLAKSDICPCDKQNYRSCEKLCASLEYLKGINGSHATVVYLTIIRCIIFAFISASTTTADRIYHSWLAVFICRLWRVWLHLVPKQELNDPKISILHSIKTKTNSSFTSTKFKFPNHHKTQQNHQQSTIPPEKMTKQQIEEQVNRAFQDAFNLLAPLGVEQILKKSKIINMKQASQHIHKHFTKSSKKADFLISMTTDENDVQSDSDLKPDFDSEYDSDSEQSTIEEDEQNELDLYDYDSEDEDDGGMNLLGHTTNSLLKTTKGLCDTINSDLKDSYFLVNIDGKKKYLHKNT